MKGVHGWVCMDGCACDECGCKGCACEGCACVTTHCTTYSTLNEVTASFERFST